MRKQHYLLVIFMLIFAVSPFTAFASVDDGEVLTHFSSPDSTNIARSVASEEENIDSFDVSPASGRWNVTNDNNTDDLVTDSILRMTTTNNATSDDITSGVGFEMNRGMRKTDGKVEYRMAARGGGNQTEYSRDQLGNKWDFEEGGIENWASISNSLDQSNGIITMVRGVADGTWGCKFTLLSISAVVYHTLEFKLIASGVVQTNLRVQYVNDAGTSSVVIEAGVVNTDWTVYNVDLSAEGNWEGNGNITEIRIAVATSALGGEIKIDYIELIGDLDYATHVEGEIEDTWDWEEGDDEGWGETFVGGAGVETIAGGFVNLTVTAASTRIIFNEGGLAIDTSLFYTLVVRINASDATSYVFPTDTGATRFGSNMDLDGTLTVLTWDLSSDSDWTGTKTNIGFWIDEDDGTLDNGDNFFIDYVLLLGHWDDSDSVIGLWDQDDLVPLLNVSCHFTSNNSHPTTSDKAYFTVELLDLDGEVAYLAQSDNFTDISDLWIQGKFSYDVLRSRLTVTINADNLTRIDKWTFPDDFTEVSGRIPALFSHEKPPYIFISTFCFATSWQEMKLDFITAPYEERKWIQNEDPTDADWLTDSVFSCFVQDDIDDEAEYSLYVPYLDAVSASMNANYTKPANLTANDLMQIGFLLSVFDADDGEKHFLLLVGFRIIHEGGNPTLHVQVLVGDLLLTTIYTQPFFGHTNPRMDFGISIYDERTRMLFQGSFTPDSTDETIAPIAITADVFIPDEVDVMSQEFVIDVFYEADFDGDIEYTGTVSAFDFIFRESFRDIPMGYIIGEKKGPDLIKVAGDLITAPIKIGWELLVAAIDLVTDSVKLIEGWLTILGTTITGAIANIQGWLTTLGATISGAIANIQGWLTALGTTISNAVDQIEGWLTTIATTISDAIGDIAADIWTKFTEVVSDVVDDIIIELTALASDVADFIDVLVQFLLPLLLALAEDIATLLVDILEFVLPLLALLAETMVEFFADIVFWIWDALGLPDLLAVADILLTGFIQFITGLPQFVTDWVNFLTAISDLFVVLGFIWIFILPIAIAPTAGDCFEKMLEHAMTSVVADWKIFGVGGRIPIVIPWAILLFWTMLDGTIFFGFF